MVWLAGQKLYGDRYIIERELGKGGFGITYLAKNKRGRRLVIKTLKDEVLADPYQTQFGDKYQHNFRDEALRLALCRHPHIVQIENAFLEGSLPCIAMEYVEGEDLWSLVKRRGMLSEAEALLYIRQIGSALAAIHEKGLLHRDVKPRNIIVRAGKAEAVLIDFGVAREFIPDVTITHTLAGSNGFAPIEQYAEKARRGECSDIYALAGTLYYLLTAEVPVPAPARAARIALNPPQQFNPHISDRVSQAILKGMAFEPADRPQSVHEWLQLLELDRFDLTEPRYSPPSDGALFFKTPDSALSGKLRRILWVNNQTASNPWILDQLQNMGVEIVPALSTAEAMQLVTSNPLPFDAVISNMGRTEEGEYRAKAGISLIEAMREAGINLPIFVYTSARVTATNEVIAAGGNGVTDSAVELFELLREHISPVSLAFNPSTAPAFDRHAPDELSSRVGADYSKLRDLLAAGNWREADRETAAAILKIAGRENSGSLKVEHIERLPCQDLYTIDQLWVKYSNGRFGFSVQQGIWESLGGTKNGNIETWCRFGARVGWRRNRSWLLWADLDKTSNAPVGQFPALLGAGRLGVCGLGLLVWFCALVSRLAICEKQLLAPEELSSAVGIDYSRLRDLLAAEKWQEADGETEAVMLQILRRESKEGLSKAEMEKFPCPDLRTIDSLWVKYSNGRFGFSVQKQIWHSVGGKPDYATYCRFVDRVGWRVSGDWLSWFDLNFTLNAPPGHLPVGFGRAVVGFGLAFLSRIETCGL